MPVGLECTVTRKGIREPLACFHCFTCSGVRESVRVLDPSPKSRNRDLAVDYRSSQKQPMSTNARHYREPNAVNQVNSLISGS